MVSVDFTQLQETLQFILKITNLLIAGSTFMILYWKTRNLLGLAIIHGLNDFLPDDTGGYVSGDSGTTVVYLIQLIVELLCFIYVYVKVAKTIDYKKTLEEW